MTTIGLHNSNRIEGNIVLYEDWNLESLTRDILISD